jgi:hypothetical protein
VCVGLGRLVPFAFRTEPAVTAVVLTSYALGCETACLPGLAGGVGALAPGGVRWNYR